MFGRTRPDSRVSSLEYRFLWKIHYHSCTLHAWYHLIYAYICYFPLDVRANRFDNVWVPWGIDSFEKYTIFVHTLHAISSHVQKYLLLSFGCSGEPFQSCVSSLKYRFLWKIQHIRVLYMHNIISYTHIPAYFLMDVRANLPDRAWVPWSIDSFEYTLSSCTYTSNIISCTQISLIFFWMFGRTSPVVCEFPEV